MAEWIQNKIAKYYLQETYFRSKDTHSLKAKRWKTFHANVIEKKAGVALHSRQNRL